MDDSTKLVDITKIVLDTFQKQELTRFESLFVLEAVKSSLQEQIIAETIKDVLNNPKSAHPGVM